MNKKAVYLIPNGPKNLANLFPEIDWEQVSEYFVQVLDEDEAVAATSTLNKVCDCGGDEKIRIHFLNYLGTYDAINFTKPRITHEATSSEYQNGLSYPLEKTDTGIERFNVRSNDTYEVKSSSHPEKDLPWLQELCDSPKAYIEWTGIQGQQDSYLPITVINKKFEKLKPQNDFRYDVILEFKLSNETIIIRN